MSENNTKLMVLLVGAGISLSQASLYDEGIERDKTHLPSMKNITPEEVDFAFDSPENGSCGNAGCGGGSGNGGCSGGSNNGGCGGGSNNGGC